MTRTRLISLGRSLWSEEGSPVQGHGEQEEDESGMVE